MKSVQQIIQDKGKEVWSISPEATVFSALELMAEKDIGALVVIDNQQVVGIISERDYSRKIILAGKFSKDTLVREIMTAKVIGVSPQHTVEDCMALMTENQVRHLPVTEGNELAGIISIGDVVKAIITEQGYLIDHLVHYITGK